MESFDAIVIGAGSGLNIADAAASKGLRVAIVESGPMGGTCLNRGCIPSKMLLHSADVAETIQHSRKFGITAQAGKADFAGIISRVSSFVDRDARGIESGIRETHNLTLFKAEGKFVGERSLRVGKKVISGEKIFIFAGTRPSIPPLEGLEGSGFITSSEALRLKKMPKSLTIIGGGYIAAELAHFFGCMGSTVTILQRGDLLVPNEDAEIAQAFTKAYSKRFYVRLNFSASAVRKKAGKFLVRAAGARSKVISSDQLLVAVGRTPNSDILDVKKAGIAVTKEGFIAVNNYLETTAPGVWAGGDIAGKYQFKHSANLESRYAVQNAFHPKSKIRVDYSAMPHAIFSSPQVAGVGSREQDLEKGSYLIGKYYYRDTAMGAAMQEDAGFAKILVDKKTKKILGCHIIGPDASTLIHEVIVAMKSGAGTIDNITKAVHVHPALSEVVQRAALSISF